jgi:hypothetical protein
MEHGAEGAFGVRRLVAALDVVLLALPGSLLPGILQTDFRPWSMASVVVDQASGVLIETRHQGLHGRTKAFPADG